jgi:hypothetical protein
MSEQDRNLAEMDDADFERHRTAQHLIQEAIDEVHVDARGQRPADVRDRLVRALAARGIGEQPARWLDAVAEGLAGGRRYVEDAREL